MGRTGSSTARVTRRTRQGAAEGLKFGIALDPQDLELLRIASEVMGHDFEDTVSLALAWGCQRLRDACPFPLPPEAGGSAVAAPWAH